MFQSVGVGSRPCISTPFSELVDSDLRYSFSRLLSNPCSGFPPGLGRPQTLWERFTCVRADGDPCSSLPPEISSSAVIPASLQADLAGSRSHSLFPQGTVSLVCCCYLRRLSQLYYGEPDRHPVFLPILEEVGTRQTGSSSSSSPRPPRPYFIVQTGEFDCQDS